VCEGVLIEQEDHTMCFKSMITISASRLRAAGFASLAAIAVMGAATTTAHAGDIKRVDMVPEGIDLAQLEVHANASGYTGTVTKSHAFMLRLYAQADGRKRIYQVQVNSPGKPALFTKHVGKSEGWAEYRKSVTVHANINNVKWQLTPKQACDLMLKDKVRNGTAKADVLKNDRKTTAVAVLAFNAWADSAASNEKNKHKNTDTAGMQMPYRVNVLCRAVL
jgi:hypothetical protein